MSQKAAVCQNDRRIPEDILFLLSVDVTSRISEHFLV